MDHFIGNQGGLLYKAPLTATVFKDFSSLYSHFSSQTSQTSQNFDQPFVYVDADGVKLVTGIVGEENTATDGVFALSVAEDGWMEMLAMYEAG